MKNPMMRHLIAATASVILLSGCAPAQPDAKAEILSAEVERLADGKIHISWKDNFAEPTQVFVTNSNADNELQRTLIGDGGSTDTLTFQIPQGTAGARPYFYLKANNGEGMWVAERVLPLEGGRNFRDLGGYEAADGRTVSWGKIYRSGSMAKLTASDYKYLDSLGIKTVCDFRTAEERKQEPNRWVVNSNIEYYTRDYIMSGADLESLFKGEVEEASVKGQMAKLYQTLPYEQSEAYAALFRSLLDRKGAVAFNCTAGKDRAGLAAALVLMALDVPYDVVLKDYELTNKYLYDSVRKDMHFLKATKDMPKTVVDALMSADPTYLASAFDEIKRKNGSVSGYFQKELSLAKSDLDKLKAIYLE